MGEPAREKKREGKNIERKPLKGIQLSHVPLTVTQTSHGCSDVPLSSCCDDFNHAFDCHTIVMRL